MSMFCFQCQETAGGKGCSKKMGVCGKKSTVANLQDLLINQLKAISFINQDLRKENKNKKETDKFIMDSLFTTITNANFDENFFLNQIKKAYSLKEELKKEAGITEPINKAIDWSYNTDADIYEASENVGVLDSKNEDIRSLKEMLTYGIKGISAYNHHAYNLGYEDDEIYQFMEKGLAAALKDKSVDELIALVMECGKTGVKTMALLDKANTETYGNPEPTEVNIGVRNNPGILISGHDLKDLEQLLEQTKNRGIDVYTHSEMLPANYYPFFKKYEHFVGNYGNAWWKQKEEFEKFNGPILMTTNCLVPPKDSYKDRVYTTGIVGFEGLTHISESEDGTKDFSQIIKHAEKCSPPEEIEKGSIVGGFAHNAVIQLADKVVEAVKSGKIRKFVVMAGCDGRFKERQYYTKFAEKLSDDTVILTAGCAKYRYNKLNLDDIDGIPRVLDAGQCNDSYSLAVIAMKLAEVFGMEDINDLPIVYNIAWYEQKAVLVLLALLSLGVKNITLGPTLPAFVSPNVLNVLVEKFNISPNNTVEKDLERLG